MLKMTNEEQHIAIWEMLQECIEHYLLYKASLDYVEKTIVLDEKVFLTMTCNAHIQMCYMVWCKIFGSDQSTNFKRLVSNDKFLEKLKCDYDITEIQFEEYVHKAKRFRNKYVAHKEKVKVIIPEFDIALKSIFTLDKILENNEYDIPFGTLLDYYDVSNEKYNDIVGRIL